MKNHSLIVVFLFLSYSVYSQATYYPLVNPSGSGEITYAPTSGFNYSHHTNYTMRIIRLTAKWQLRILCGEPIIDGVFKWEAASETPVDYLDYRDCVLLECTPQKSVGYSVYIKLSPTVPKSGEGYGYNTPGSPSWEDVFCTREGKQMTHEIPNFNANTAKSIWKNGFRVTGVLLIREGGNDGYYKKDNNPDDYWDTPENTTTTRDVQNQKEYEKSQQEKEEAQAKYNALSNPFTKAFKTNDTIYDEKIKPLETIDDYFRYADITITAKNNITGATNSVNSITSELALTEGWNTVRFILKKGETSLRDSLRLFYKRGQNLIAFYDKDKHKYGYKNTDGQIIIEPVFYRAKDFSEGLGAISNEDGKWGFIEYSGNIVIDYHYSNVSKFSEGLVCIKTSNKNWSFINRKNNIVISNLEYNQVGDFENGKAKVSWQIYKTAKSESEESYLRKDGYVDERKGLTLTRLNYTKTEGDNEKTNKYIEKDLVKYYNGSINKIGLLIESNK